MTERIRLQAFAKVNYALEVLGVRPDGYHELSTVFQSISLYDEVEIERAETGFELVVEPEGAETGPLEKNTVYKAHRLLTELTRGKLPVRVMLRKGIPTGAGLGGGSSDAAATLVGLNELFGLELSDAELKEAGLGAGADVPFCIGGGTAVGRGVGEGFSPVPPPPPHHLVVAKPAAGEQTLRRPGREGATGGESRHARRGARQRSHPGDEGSRAGGAKTGGGASARGRLGGHDERDRNGSLRYLRFCGGGSDDGEELAGSLRRSL